MKNYLRSCFQNRLFMDLPISVGGMAALHSYMLYFKTELEEVIQATRSVWYGSKRPGYH